MQAAGPGEVQFVPDMPRRTAMNSLLVIELVGEALSISR